MTSAVTAPMRAAGWNVRLTIGTCERPHEFAGVYQNPRAPTLTFADICAELALCFEIPPGGQGETQENSENANISWTNSIAFALTDIADEADDITQYPAFITHETLDKTVPGLPSPSMREPRNITYHIVLHRPCSLTAGLLKDHLQAQCAHYISDPRRFHHPSYLPYNKTPSDPRLSVMPLRRKLKARSQSPPKRSAGSTSPDKPDEGEGDDPSSMLAPASLDIDMDSAKKQISHFRMACIAQATCCAVSGDGEPWSSIQPIGPGVHACHIVPQQHFHLYPMENDNGDGTLEDSARRLCQAWHMTWSADNGILLMKHLHDFFDSRLFSIHPTTLRIRIFVPYKALEPYHGKKAQVARSVDRMALRHHYDMCCIENMAAKRATQEIPSSVATSRMSTSVTGASLVHTASAGSTPFNGRTDLPLTPPSGHTSTQTVPGDPSKRRRPAHEDDHDADDDDEDEDDAEDKNKDRRKQVRREEQYGFDSYITPYNSRAFLADVNWELRRLQGPQ
ncbi:hypothetical protein CCM_00379 [Cordyceps militaris CM01]|uniref:HNH nuclease domain-containing protein n=1 Tax=Cordyceps militaris (strain CM01) TaxID=983644 RepID=G3J3P9_CORMM|nr:uncharacterized protein CCM_00379 [Cordyceps militaris CM01]EGX95725.1 hypothetical protein CCM_00379 [Cordyceps militaris CM01]